MVLGLSALHVKGYGTCDVLAVGDSDVPFLVDIALSLGSRNVTAANLVDQVTLAHMANDGVFSASYLIHADTAIASVNSFNALIVQCRAACFNKSANASASSLSKTITVRFLPLVTSLICTTPISLSDDAQLDTVHTTSRPATMACPLPSERT